VRRHFPYPSFSLLDLLHTVKTALQIVALSAADFTQAALSAWVKTGQENNRIFRG